MIRRIRRLFRAFRKPGPIEARIIALRAELIEVRRKHGATKPIARQIRALRHEILKEGVK